MIHTYIHNFIYAPKQTVLVKVMAPSTTSVHAAAQKPGTAPANTLLSYPVKISSQEPVFVVGVSVKGTCVRKALLVVHSTLQTHGQSHHLTNQYYPTPKKYSQGPGGPVLQGRGGGLRLQLHHGQQVDLHGPAPCGRQVAGGRLRRLQVGARRLGTSIRYLPAWGSIYLY